MAYAPLDEHFDEHPKYESLELEHYGLMACAITYCNRNLTDGKVSFKAVRGFGKSGKGPKFAKKLTDAGIWRDVETGWEIVGYLDHNPSKAEVLAKREAARTRKDAYRKGSPLSVVPRVVPLGQDAGQTRGHPTGQTAGQDAGQNRPSHVPSRAGGIHSAALHSDPLHEIPPTPSGGVVVPEPSETRERGVPASEWRMHQALFVAAYEAAVRATTGNDRWSMRRTGDLQIVLEKCCLGSERGDIEGWIATRVRDLVAFIASVPADERRFWADPDAGAMLRWFNRKQPAVAPPSPTAKRQVTPPYLTEYVDPYETAGGSR